MKKSGTQIVKLAEMAENAEADVFVLFVAREKLLTREKKPYVRVTFRDETREVTFPIWENAPHFAECQEAWEPGRFYKIRATHRATNYGPQLEIVRIREATAKDEEDGFDPNMGMPASPFDPLETYGEIRETLLEYVTDAGLLAVVERIYETYREPLLAASAAKGKHHATAGGLLEHTRNVLKTAVFLADQYAEILPDMNPSLCKSVVAAGAALHDVGKLRELTATAGGFTYTPEGTLLGHIVMGRDYVRDAVRELAAEGVSVCPEMQLRLEHAILSHQSLPEWGSPKTTMTPEALIIHYADDLDAKYYIMYAALAAATDDAEFTPAQNPLKMTVFRGLKQKK